MNRAILTRSIAKLWNLFRSLSTDEELEREIGLHVSLLEEECIRRGLSPGEARREARRTLGGVEQAKQAHRDQRGILWLDNLIRDLKFALRQFLRNRGFAVAAILVLALGIGAGVAIFAFVDAALLEPLPYANPSRLMSVNESGANCPRCPLSYPDFLDWQRMNHSFSSLDVYNGTGFLLRTPSGAESVNAERVSGGFFRTLGIHPMIGRDFSPGEDRPGGPNVLLLSYRTWLNRFGGQRDALGRTMDLNGTAFTIIGVLPRAFSFGPAGNAEFWVPINSLSPHEHSRDFYNFWGIGRLRDGVDVVAMHAEMNSIAKLLLREDGPRQLQLLGASVIPLSEVIVGDIRPILLVLLGGVVLLLLIACVNVGSLVLARSESRQREIAVRGALGASPARLVQQFITEGFVLSLFGCIGGLMAAVGFIRLLGQLVPKDIAASMPFLENVHLNVHACAFAAAICVLAAVLTSVTPIFRLSVQNGRDALAEGNRGTVSRFWQRIGTNLVVVELFVAVVLLTSAGLLTRSLYRLLHVPLGFDPAHLATLKVSLPATASTDTQTGELYREISRRIGQLPGVQSVGLTNLYPVECHCSLDLIQVIGKPELNDHNLVDERHISAGYLPTLGARLMRGRLFTEADGASKPGVAIVNASLARRYFPDEDPIGQRFSNTEGGQPSVWEVVGEIEDVHEGPLDASSEPAEYFPIHDRGFSLVVRTRQDPSAVLPSITDALHRIDNGIVVSNETTIENAIDATQAALLHRSSAWLIGGFAWAALILSVVGLYGVIAYSVRQRRREIGVRIALGAQRGAIYALVLGQAGWLVGIGIAFGLIGSLGASRLLRTLLFGVNAWDPVTLSGVSALLAVVSLAAVFLPARRAASVDPAEVLRTE
jgi:macrolide transport system ATP-binding/permease protein